MSSSSASSSSEGLIRPTGQNSALSSSSPAASDSCDSLGLESLRIADVVSLSSSPSPPRPPADIEEGTSTAGGRPFCWLPASEQEGKDRSRGARERTSPLDTHLDSLKLGGLPLGRRDEIAPLPTSFVECEEAVATPKSSVIAANLTALARLNELQEQQEREELPLMSSKYVNASLAAAAATSSLDYGYYDDCIHQHVPCSHHQNIQRSVSFPAVVGNRFCSGRASMFDSNWATPTMESTMSAVRGNDRNLALHPRSLYVSGSGRYLHSARSPDTTFLTHQQASVPGGGQLMQIRCKFGYLGNGWGTFNSPHGFCLGVNEEIIVADTNNHRIQVFDTNGIFQYDFGSPGKDEGYLWHPRKITVLPPSASSPLFAGAFVVCDRGGERSRMQIFSGGARGYEVGRFLRRIAIRFIDIVAGLAVTSDGLIVAVDSVTPTVFFISPEAGELRRWVDCSDFMAEPSDVAVHDRELYICDFKGHCVTVLDEDGNYLRRVGCETMTPYPNGIDVSDAGDILVGDSHGNQFHIAVFSKEGRLIGQFTCPTIKVSRCCGLKITSSGFVVTLAKNNHHVLVLDTLYVC